MNLIFLIFCITFVLVKQMFMPNAKPSDFKIISMSHLARRSKISKMRLYCFLKDRYRTLSESERNRVANALYEDVFLVFQSLGFQLDPPVPTDQDHPAGPPKKRVAR